MYVQGKKLEIGDKLVYNSISGGQVKVRVIMTYDHAVDIKVTSRKNIYPLNYPMRIQEGSPWLELRK